MVQRSIKKNKSTAMRARGVKTVRTRSVKSRGASLRRSMHPVSAEGTDPWHVWRHHPYRSLVEGLPVWLAILTLYMFSVVYLQSWTFALLFTLIIVVMIAMLFDLLHHLHKHLDIPNNQLGSYDAWLTRFGRGFLVGFAVYFLVLFILFAFSFEKSENIVFMFGTLLTLLGIGMVFFLLIGYVALIIFVGFPRVRHQLSLAALLFFCYFYLFFAFAVRRVEL